MSYETGYKIPTELIELLIQRYAPDKERCDFCDSKHLQNDICWMCQERKVRCDTRCKNSSLMSTVCAVCYKPEKPMPCKLCRIKYPAAIAREITGRQAIRKVSDKLFDQWICGECLKMESCRSCGNIKRCPRRCNSPTYY